MKDLLMSQTGFWTAFTILFIVILMGWFFAKVNKLSKESSQKKEK